MRLDGGLIGLELERGQMARLRDAGPLEVRCESGRVWITEDARAADVWLREGERATLRGRGLALIEAIQAARLRLRPAR